MELNPDMRILKVWHGIKHETVTDIELPQNQSAGDWVKKTYSDGGFWIEGAIFIPWHRINFIQLEM